MSSSKPASDAALVDVADEIEVAIDKAPGPDHGPGDLDLRLDPSLQPNSPEPAGPGSAQHEGGHESRDAQGLPQPQQAQHIDHAPQGEDRNQDKYVSHDHVAEFNRSESPSASRNGNGNDNGTGFGNGNDIGVGSGNNREQTEQDGLGTYARYFFPVVSHFGDALALLGATFWQGFHFTWYFGRGKHMFHYEYHPLRTPPSGEHSAKPSRNLETPCGRLIRQAVDALPNEALQRMPARGNPLRLNKREPTRLGMFALPVDLGEQRAPQLGTGPRARMINCRD